MSDSGHGFTYRNETQEPHLVELVRELFAQHGPIRIKFAKETKQHTRQQQCLFFVWCELMHKHFYKTDKCTAKEKTAMHDLMCHQFLGYDTKIVGKTSIGPSLKTLTWPVELPVGDMTRMMKQMEAWALDHGLMLPIPEDNDYHKLRDSA